MKRRLPFWLAWYLVLALAVGGIGLLLDHRLDVTTGLNRTTTLGPGFGGALLQGPIVASDVSLGFLEEAGLPGRFVSVRWRGHWYIGARNGRDLYAGADDRVAMRVDGQLVLERSPVEGMHTVSLRVPLSQGLHELDVEYEQHRGSYRLNVEWSPSGGPPRPLDLADLFPVSPSTTELSTHGRLGILRAVAWMLWIVPLIVIAGVVAVQCSGAVGCLSSTVRTAFPAIHSRHLGPGLERGWARGP